MGSGAGNQKRNGAKVISNGDIRIQSTEEQPTAIHGDVTPGKDREVILEGEYAFAEDPSARLDPGQWTAPMKTPS